MGPKKTRTRDPSPVELALPPPPAKAGRAETDAARRKGTADAVGRRPAAVAEVRPTAHRGNMAIRLPRAADAGNTVTAFLGGLVQPGCYQVALEQQCHSRVRLQGDQYALAEWREHRGPAALALAVARRLMSEAFADLQRRRSEGTDFIEAFTLHFPEEARAQLRSLADIFAANFLTRAPDGTQLGGHNIDLSSPAELEAWEARLARLDFIHRASGVRERYLSAVASGAPPGDALLKASSLSTKASDENFRSQVSLLIATLPTAVAAVFADGALAETHLRCSNCMLIRSSARRDAVAHLVSTAAAAEGLPPFLRSSRIKLTSSAPGAPSPQDSASAASPTKGHEDEVPTPSRVLPSTADLPLTNYAVLEHRIGPVNKELEELALRHWILSAAVVDGATALLYLSSMITTGNATIDEPARLALGSCPIGEVPRRAAQLCRSFERAYAFIILEGPANRGHRCAFVAAVLELQS
jgi:hypothetical protein